MNCLAIGHNGPVSGHGKRAGARTRRPLSRRALALAAAGVAALALWASLVWAAIHFGTQARGGNTSDWWLTGAITTGAIAALFACFVLVTQAIRTQVPTRPETDSPSAKGGKRAAR